MNSSDGKLVYTKKRTHALVIQNDMCGFSEETALHALPKMAVKPIMCLYFNTLVATIELENGDQVDLESDPFNFSPRHLWGGVIVTPTPQRIRKLKKFVHFLLGNDWENNSSLQLLHHKLICSSCSRLHHFYLPYTSEDVFHSEEEWAAI